MQTLKIGLVSVGDRIFNKERPDKGLPALKSWLEKAIINSKDYLEHIIPDDQKIIEETLITLVDQHHCDLILTSGGTGPYPRDVTPDATLAIADKIMPGFGEQMRQVSLYFVPTAILSRQIGVVRKNCLIINLPGRPNAIQETLEGVKDDQGNIIAHGIFAAVPLCIDALGGPYIKTNDGISENFIPMSEKESSKK